jgi:hypothetical protein
VEKRYPFLPVGSSGIYISKIARKENQESGQRCMVLGRHCPWYSSTVSLYHVDHTAPLHVIQANRFSKRANRNYIASPTRAFVDLFSATICRRTLLIRLSSTGNPVISSVVPNKSSGTAKLRLGCLLAILAGRYCIFAAVVAYSLDRHNTGSNQ